MERSADIAPAATIYDVAARAGVSIATVSRVVNGHGSIRESTRARVTDAIRELRFVPNNAARGLSSRSKKVIGLVFARVPSEDALLELEEEMLLFTDSVIRGAELAAQRHGYSLLLHGTGGERAASAIAALTGTTDGLILTDRVLSERRAATFARQFPIVLLAGSGRSRTSSTVRVDNRLGMQMLAEHLILEHGLRRLAFLAGSAGSPDSEARAAAFRQTAEALGATVEPEEWWQGDWTSAGAAATVALRLARDVPLPEAIACANDSSAVGAQHALNAAGLQIPSDVAVTGFDDIPLARHLSPGLTTVHQPIQQLGVVAVEALLAKLDGTGGAPRDVVLPTRLVVRASCGCSQPARPRAEQALAPPIGAPSRADMKAVAADRAVDAMAPRPLPLRPWVGVNFWSRAGARRMWSERYSAELVREELDVLAAHGVNVTRSFCYWPDFMPEPERLDPDAVERYRDFLHAHQERGMSTIPTFIVGHMSGDNWAPDWAGDRDAYRDVWLVGQQAWFVGEVARQFANHPAVAGWLLSNEMPLYGGPAPSEDVTAWARLLMQALRSAGAQQPASVGDGAWGIEVSGRDNGFSLRRLAPLVDFLGPHVYPMSDDPVRQHSAAALACALTASFDRPVVLEEFGISSDFASDDNAAHYYRQILHSSLLAGATGWIAWNNCDFDDLAEEDPYRHHPFELHFGLTDRSGAPKPALVEFARFSALVADLPRSTLTGRVAPAQASVVIPEHFERVLPFTSELDRDDVRDTLLQAYVAGREADLRIGIARERDGFDSTSRLFLAPSMKILTAPGMSSLRERATAGATVYLSYFSGSTPTQRGPWLYGLQETFGVRHALRYGLGDPFEHEELALTFLRRFGPIEAGEQLVFKVNGSAHARTFLPVEPMGADVVATDRHGRPALLSHPIGTGTAVLCTYPLEYMAARTPWANPEPTWRLYEALADVAGVDRPLRCADPRVSCVVAGAGASALASVTNLSDQALEAVIRTSAGRECRLNLGPYAVQTFVNAHLDP